jgi:hypothetical protein
MKPAFVFLFSLILLSCEESLLKGLGEKTSSENTIEQNLIGNWENQEYQDSLITLHPVARLSQDQYGISFYEDGTLKEIKNSGWCGTPPIAYGEFYGTWDLSPDSVLTLETTFWGGEFYLEWKILEITDKSMIYYLQRSESIYIE